MVRSRTARTRSGRTAAVALFGALAVLAAAVGCTTRSEVDPAGQAPIGQQLAPSASTQNPAGSPVGSQVTAPSAGTSTPTASEGNAPTGSEPATPAASTDPSTAAPTGSSTAGSSTAGTTGSLTPSSNASPAGSATPSSTAPVVRTLLKSGMTGADVKALQSKLNGLGYWNGTADGTYGELLSQAVMAYQKAAGIDADGVAGPDTTTTLARNVRPVPRTTTGDAIEVDKAKQLVMVVVGGKLKYTFNTSTGSGQTYMQPGNPGELPTEEVAVTPEGKFVIERSIDGLRKSKLGELWRPRYFYEGYALHGANSVPSYPASHGCVRLANDVIDFVWASNLAPIGRTVWVY